MIAVIFMPTFPPKNVEAEAFTIAAGGVAVSATAVYILGALAIGGLATAVGVEYGDEINAHARSVWDTASTTVKTGFATALAGAQNGVLNLTGATKTWFNNAVNKLTNLSFVGKSQNITSGFSNTANLPTNNFNNFSGTARYFQTSITLPSNYLFAAASPGLGLVTTTTLGITVYSDGTVGFSGNSIGQNLSNSTSNYIWIDSSLDYANAILHNFRSAVTYSDLVNVVNRFAAGDLAIITTAALDSYYNTVINNTASVFGSGTLGLNLPSDNLYLPKTNSGETLTRSDDIFVYPNGQIYTGDIDWGLPNTVVLDLDGVRIPALPLLDFPGHYVNVNTGQIIKTLETDIPGDVPFPPATVVPEPTQTEVGGLFAKLWDWLKKILDGILGLPAKLIALLTTLLSTLFVPSETFWLENFNELKLLFAEKLDADSYLSVLDSIKNIYSPSFQDVKLPSIMGAGETVIIKASYINSVLPTVHDWVKGLFFVLLVFYNLNNVYKLLRGGDITSAINRRERRDKD